MPVQRQWCLLLMLVGLHLGTASLAAAQQQARVHALVVTGIGGEDFYTERFAGWSESLREVLTEALGLPQAQVQVLNGNSDAPATRATRENMLAALARIAQQSRAGDLIGVWYIGHATARGDHLALNLPGPDLRVEALGGALDALAGRKVLVALAAPSTGAMVPALSAPERVVVTATANAAEQHAPLFAGPLAAAFAAPEADTDKDRRVSVLEAFLHASSQVRAQYKREGLLQVEHALLDDNADGRGTRAEQIIANRERPEAETALDDGPVAARWFLDLQLRQREDAGDPARLRLRLQARELVARIEQLKREKQKYFASDFDDALETLLVELALNRRAYRNGAPQAASEKEAKP